MDAQFATQGGRATWVGLIQAGFDRWSEVSGLTFVRESLPGVDWDDGADWSQPSAPGLRGDLRIGMHLVDGPGGTIFYAGTPAVGGNIVFDSADNWSQTSNLNRYLRNAAMWSAGAAVGLRPICSTSHDFLMEQIFVNSVDGPQHDDIRGIQHLYGDPFEEDDTPQDARNLGSIGWGTTVDSICDVPPPATGVVPPNTSRSSFHYDGDVDYFTFQVPLGSTITASVNPIGITFFQGTPAAIGTSCANQVSLNTSILGNLKIELLAPDGVTVLASGDAPFLGVPDTFDPVLVAHTTLYLKISELNTPVQPQLYEMSITVHQGCFSLDDCNGNTLPDDCDVQLGISTDGNNDGVLDECQGFVGAPACPGDQSIPGLTPCPCSNFGIEGRGCANSAVAVGALLTASGLTQPIDTMSLDAADMPSTASAIFLKGDLDNGTGVVFGDGVRCVDGNLIRLGTLTSVAGAASYPGPGQPLVSVRGQTPVGSGLTGHYQTYYRNAAATFCPPATFNVTNGFRITW